MGRCPHCRHGRGGPTRSASGPAARPRTRICAAVHHRAHPRPVPAERPIRIRARPWPAVRGMARWSSVCSPATSSAPTAAWCTRWWRTCAEAGWALPGESPADGFFLRDVEGLFAGHGPRLGARAQAGCDRRHLGSGGRCGGMGILGARPASRCGLHRRDGRHERPPQGMGSRGGARPPSGRLRLRRDCGGVRHDRAAEPGVVHRRWALRNATVDAGAHPPHRRPLFHRAMDPPAVWTLWTSPTSGSCASSRRRIWRAPCPERPAASSRSWDGSTTPRCGGAI